VLLIARKSLSKSEHVCCDYGNFRDGNRYEFIIQEIIDLIKVRFLIKAVSDPLPALNIELFTRNHLSRKSQILILMFKDFRNISCYLKPNRFLVSCFSPRQACSWAEKSFSRKFSQHKFQIECEGREWRSAVNHKYLPERKKKKLLVESSIQCYELNTCHEHRFSILRGEHTAQISNFLS
jgi:hypothetical protein